MKPRSPGFVLLALLITICLILSILSEKSSGDNPLTEVIDAFKNILEPLPSYPVVPTPENGTAQFFTSEEKIASFNVENSSVNNFFLKLISVYSQQTIMTVFVRGGYSVSVKVPVGKYYIKYTSGNFWFGDEHLFGVGAVYQIFDKTFEFQIKGNKISGHTIILNKSFDGNLPSKYIKDSEF